MAAASSSSTPRPDPQPQQIEIELKPSPSISPPKKITPIPWTHLETIHLIEAYQEKWYSLKRGQLKASQWEEVAVSVAARCGYDEPSKSATQCRHKIEKLRKRYRSEKQRPSPSAWPYFDPMDQMEHGPFPISVRPIAMIKNRISDSSDDDEDDDDFDEINKSRSINHILRKPPPFATPVGKSSTPRHWNGGGVGGGGGGGGGPAAAAAEGSRYLRNPIFRKRRKSFELDEEEEEEQGGGNDPFSGLASVIRAFGERFVRIENMKLEMMKETERYRMEMETKRTGMILESQHRMVESITRAFNSHKKSKKSQEI